MFLAFLPISAKIAYLICYKNKNKQWIWIKYKYWNK